VESKSGLVAIDLQTNKMIGASRYYDLQEGRVSIGYTFLARSHWGGKFNRELKTLMLDHAFKFVSKVGFDIAENNKRSRRAIEKIGASFIRSQMNKGKPYTHYGIDEKAFRAALQE
jgi:RimJ/RimL family protein N-acetyltransferase